MTQIWSSHIWPKSGHHTHIYDPNLVITHIYDPNLVITHIDDPNLVITHDPNLVITHMTQIWSSHIYDPNLVITHIYDPIWSSHTFMTQSGHHTHMYDPNQVTTVQTNALGPYTVFGHQQANWLLKSNIRFPLNLFGYWWFWPNGIIQNDQWDLLKFCCTLSVIKHDM